MKAAVLASVLAATAAACARSAPQAAVDARQPVAASTARVETTELASSFESGGVVRARTTALIASRVMAPIVAVHVRAGDRVRRDAVLVTLDARDSAANKARTDAAALSASETVRAAEAEVRAAESAVQLARVTHDRVAVLHEKRSATLQELDQAVAALSGAEAQRASAQARLAAAAAGRDAAQAAADAATVAITYATLTAPFDGVVTERSADPGSMAAPGSPLLTVEDPATFRLEVPVEESRAALISVGQRADIKLDSSADGNWLTGRVVEIAHVDPASHSFLVKVELPALPDLRSGLFARARFPGAPRRAPTVPDTSLVKRGELTFVYLVDAEHRARLRPVSPGARSQGRTEVLSGLREGDVVVAQPGAALADGMPIAGTRP